MMDAIAATLGDTKHLSSFSLSPNLKDILLHSVPVPITYSGATPFMEGLDTEYPAHVGLALRVLYW